MVCKLGASGKLWFSVILGLTFTLSVLSPLMGRNLLLMRISLVPHLVVNEFLFFFLGARVPAEPSSVLSLPPNHNRVGFLDISFVAVV